MVYKQIFLGKKLKSKSTNTILNFKSLGVIFYKLLYGAD